MCDFFAVFGFKGRFAAFFSAGWPCLKSRVGMKQKNICGTKGYFIMDSSKITALMSLFSLVWYVLIAVGYMKMFKKAGKSSIWALIPVVNFFVLVDAVTNGKWYKGLWMIVPIADIVFTIKFAIKTAKCYGYGTGFGILNIFFPYICALVMGFSDKQFFVTED